MSDSTKTKALNAAMLLGLSLGVMAPAAEAQPVATDRVAPAGPNAEKLEPPGGSANRPGYIKFEGIDGESVKARPGAQGRPNRPEGAPKPPPKR